MCLCIPSQKGKETVTADKNSVTAENHHADNEPGKEKTGPVSQRMAERSGEFRMSTT